MKIGPLFKQMFNFSLIFLKMFFSIIHDILAPPSPRRRGRRCSSHPRAHRETRRGGDRQGDHSSSSRQCLNEFLSSFSPSSSQSVLKYLHAYESCIVIVNVSSQMSYFLLNSVYLKTILHLKDVEFRSTSPRSSTSTRSPSLLCSPSSEAARERSTPRYALAFELLLTNRPRLTG